MQNLIRQEYHQNIPVPAMQKILGDGYFKTKIDKRTMQQKLVDITDFLTKANNIVCAEAIETINGYYNYLQDVDYLVVTGGTGAAWFDMIKDFL